MGRTLTVFRLLKPAHRDGSITMDIFFIPRHALIRIRWIPIRQDTDLLVRLRLRTLFICIEFAVSTLAIETVALSQDPLQFPKPSFLYGFSRCDLALAPQLFKKGRMLKALGLPQFIIASNGQEAPTDMLQFDNVQWIFED